MKHYYVEGTDLSKGRRLLHVFDLHESNEHDVLRSTGLLEKEGG